MNSTAFLPEEMETEELRVIIKDVNLFNEPTDSYASMCYEELAKRESENAVVFVSPYDEGKVEMMAEAAYVRSWLIQELGKSMSHRIRHSGSKELTPEEVRKLEAVADSMNIEHWNYSIDFVQTYATSGNFHYDDLIEIINTTKNLRETAQDIAEIKREAKEEFNALCDFINENYDELGEEVISQDDEKCEEAAEIISEVSAVNEISTIDTKPSILIVSSNNEKCEDLYSEKSKNMSYLKLDDKAFQLFRKMQKKAPKQLVYAGRFTLNDMARDLRGVSLKTVDEKMTIRNKGLTRKSITYRRASGSNLSSMESKVGSAAIATRFTGFGEQEGAKVVRRKRFATKRGRRRWRGKIPAKHRHNRKFPNLTDAIGMRNVGKEERALAMFGRLHREGKLGRLGDDKIFVKTKYTRGSKLPRGMMRFGPNKSRNRNSYRTKTKRKYNTSIRVLQVQPKKKSILQPKVNKWLRTSGKRYFATGKPNMHFIRNMNKQVEFMKKFKK
jgi:hypothetical protein